MEKNKRISPEVSAAVMNLRAARVLREDTYELPGGHSRIRVGQSADRQYRISIDDNLSGKGNAQTWQERAGSVILLQGSSNVETLAAALYESEKIKSGV